ncbi:MAG: Holliday junction resolvase RuvX [Aminobacterium sp.]|jgi:putative Holliday junction resolvase|uniref:Holliday junction resolvase RuvX n=1 Tax=unclassified Aminobacterium TaxID=2685012 RepID=UPI001BCBE4F3|nr:MULTISPECIES: Holliday junction resolvase RuvX [unclassified Aminobacterium]MDD2205853.1 Holliday junction resolvase RuvX [Aminobacterium sp.]MDD3425696.1 Holliday junction resolvase RuvX [Aminobacterium sp.]MDD3706698.1 Holliday junction resolvase RuvX [Aminobacterium sp.]MDD4228132.1 Holliday junction resolvase RuvX [Aminobacterium sp.]MDD4550877.1 Holliday junction resolvase RuvX [Aminobacterium sp.]
MSRILALDIGSKRIGVAVSDPLGCFAQGIGFIPMNKSWFNKLDEYVASLNITMLLVGYPLRTNGSPGPEAEKIKGIAQELKERYPHLSLELWDERFTTAIAQQVLLEGNVSRKKRKNKVDQLAAALILQNYLDHTRGV